MTEQSLGKNPDSMGGSEKLSLPEITLRKGNTEVSVVPERGGIISAYKVDGVDIIHTNRDWLMDPSKKIRFGGPILFPNGGPGGSLAGEEELPNNGLVRLMKWEAGEQESTDEYESIKMHVSSNEETRKSYPHEFDLVREVRVYGNGKVTDVVTIKNNGDFPMPAAEGRHPFWDCAQGAKAGVTSNVEGFDAKAMAEQEEYDEPFANPGTVRIDMPAYEDTPAKRIWQITSPDTYQNFYFYTVQGLNALCGEPWTRKDKAIFDHEQAMQIPPHSSRVLPITMIAEINPPPGEPQLPIAA